MEVFVSLHRCVEVEVGDIDVHEFGASSLDDAVDKDIDEDQFGSEVSAFFGIIDLVDANSGSCLV